MAIAPTYAGSGTQSLPNEVPGAARDFAVTGTVGASDTYVTGGFAVTAATFGLTKIHWVGPVLFSTGHIGMYLPSTGKIKVFSTALTEVTSTSTDLQSATFVAFGSGK